MKQQRAVKVELYPTDEQRILIHKTFGCVRAVWNDMLGDEQEFYAAADKHFIPTPAKYKEKRPYLSEVDSLALCNAQLALKKAFKRFFKNPGHFGHPKFKTKKKAKKSYTTNCQYHVSGPTVYTAKDAIRLPKLGLVKAKLYRNTHDNWVLKSATISETKSGRIFCALLYEFDVPVPKEVLPTLENSIGLDYSSPLFYVDHENRSPDKPQWFRESEAKLAHEQRLLSHMKYGSKNYIRQLRKIEVLQERTANQRKDFAHKESRRIANAYGAVCVEDLDLQAMAQSLNLGKATNDNGFGMFREFLKYKLEEQGKHLIKVDKWYPSSKTCHYCGGYYKDLQLGEEEWICPHCGKHILRNQNAGINIRREGIRQFYAERAVEPVTFGEGHVVTFFESHVAAS